MRFLTTSEWLTLAGLVISIVVPIGSLIIFFNERARRSREKMYDKFDEMGESLGHLHDCFHRIELRMVSLEAQSGRQEERDLRR